MRSIAMAAVLFCGSFLLAGQDKPAVREIPTGDFKVKLPRGGKATEPTIIKTLDDLTKNDVIAGEAEKIKKQVNFDKENLVLFAWGGSGQDKLASDLKTADKKSTAVFTYTRGLTRDFRQHLHLYVVPMDADVKVEAAK